MQGELRKVGEEEVVACCSVLCWNFLKGLIETKKNSESGWWSTDWWSTDWWSTDCQYSTSHWSNTFEAKHCNQPRRVKKHN
jgi:hypothetical protein